MKHFDDPQKNSIRQELAVIWAAHHAVGLKGQMCLYTLKVQEPLRSKEAGLEFWFGPDDTEKLLPEIERLYNDGNLPNSPLLLNPIVHDKNKKPLGSGIIWSIGFALGIEAMDIHQRERIVGLKALAGDAQRGDAKACGLKMIGFSDKVLPPLADGTVDGCRELFEIANFANDSYYRFYMLSGLNYLAKHGGFIHPDFFEIVPADTDIKKLVTTQKINADFLKDALTCWKAYDRHHSLYIKFGVNPDNIEQNLKFYNLCARDVELFDATGAKHADAETLVTFDLLVKGWVPRGAVTIIGATGGTGKSSLAHNLAVKAAIDYREDEPPPTWLGSEIDLNFCREGLCVYFSGEDGPAICHARAKVFDPEGRAKRLMFQRTEFGEGGNLGTFLKRLMKLPEVPLIVIDPARKYLTGDENDAGAVSEFFEAIEEFAIRKNSAMVVVHHLVKGAKPKHVLDIYDLLRGSQVFIDRARVVIGLYRDGKDTVAGLAKNNIPPQLGMVTGERLYARDGKRLELVLSGVREENMTEEQIEALKSQE